MTAYGTSCAGSSATPRHTGSGVAEIGNKIQLRLSSARRDSSAILLLGFSKSTWNRLPLPFDLSGAGAPGCKLYAPGAIMMPATTSSFGTASVPVDLPDDKNLIGKRFYTQFACFDLPANQLGLTFTNGLETRVGGWK